MNDLVDFLRNLSLFSNLKESHLSELANNFERLELLEGDYLFREGETGDALFILFSGKLLATTKHKKNDQYVGFIKPGEVVGELALFSSQPRSASIRAVYPSLLFRIEKATFQELCNKNTQMLWEITAFIANRAQLHISQLHRKAISSIIFFVSLDHYKIVESIFDELKNHNSKNYNITFVGRMELINSADLGILFKRANEERSTTLFALDFSDLFSNREWLSFADKIIFVVKDPTQDLSSISRFFREEIEKIGPDIERELILLHEAPKSAYPNTQKYLNLCKFSRWYHVCLQSPVTCRRLLRFLSGHAIGLVLSGGGVKGWAAVGAIQALYDRGVEIDCIGGTSAGASVAACFALSSNQKTFLEKFKTIQRLYAKNPIALKNMTFPLISIFKGENETDITRKIYKEVLIQDLSLPFFCVSTNLSLYSEHVWDTGYLWQAVRASIAVPPLVPPLILNGQLHVDGAIVNSFPVDVMSNKLDNLGFILGIETSKNIPDEERYNFPSSIGILDAIRIKFNFSKDKFNYINIFEITERAITTGARFKSFQNSKMADLLIKPELSSYKYSDFNKQDEMIAIGYEEAKRQLNTVPFDF